MKFGDPDETLEESYFPISPLLIAPEVYGEFAIYLRKGRHYLLFTRKGEFSQKHQGILHENAVQEVYLHSSQKPDYDSYLEQNLKKILTDESVPLPIRSGVLHYASTSVMREVFERSRNLLEPRILEKLANIVRSSLGFFSGHEALRSVAPILSHENNVIAHSVNVFIYSSAVFETMRASEEGRVQCGLGTILHDIGKSNIPKRVLYKRGRLNSEEKMLLKLHPQKGVGICSNVPLGQVAIHCILFHHEKGDGSGYPAGLLAALIPLHAKITAITDAYDSLTSVMPFGGEPLSPSQALTVMREHRTGFYDMELLDLFTRILTKAGIIQV